MDKKNFTASNWFIQDESAEPKKVATQAAAVDSVENILAPFYHNSSTPPLEDNSFNKYFVPGWKGESLTSRNVNVFTKILDELKADAKKTFNSKDELSRKLKLGLYNEFLAFAEFKNINCANIDHYTSFWTELKNPESEYAQAFEEFVEILSFRIAVIYLLKVRFLITMKEQRKVEITKTDLFNPNATISKEFRPGSSFELKATAFEQNIFSWYRPNECMGDALKKFSIICHDLNITEIVKTISTKSEKILGLSSSDYSHSLSHKNFGLFTNCMLINFPAWLNNQQSKTPNAYMALNNEMEIISCKFAGDFIESLSLSHWLAQDANKNIKWNQILCPDFKGFEFTTGSYLKVINQIQFLTFLSQIANIQGREPKLFVSQITRSHLYNRKNTDDIQRTLLSDSQSQQSTYDRIVLNLNIIPKSNPQHYILNQVTAQKQYLKENGFIYLHTSKKIFVPSQKTKVTTLLKDFKVECIVSLSSLEGKGELGSYIYILKRQPEFLPRTEEKQSCYRLRYHGDLQSFHEFSCLTNLTQMFFHDNFDETPPLYQKSYQGFRLEFFQDAIVEGKLINSANKDSTQVTHPNYFNKLMSVCNSFDYFFDIQSVDFNHGLTKDDSNSLFDLSQSFTRDSSEFTIIVDQRQKSSVKLEIIPTKSLEAKAYDYGHALCSYFHIYPKWNGININTFKEFFSSSIGMQLTGLTFHNEHTKVKANLSKLLVPKFFNENKELPHHLHSAFSFLDLDVEKVFDTHPTQLIKSYEEISQFLNTVITTYPSEVLSKLANFKRVIQRSVEISEANRSAINFNNPVLKSPLLLSKTYSIYPDNTDIYTEFHSEAINLIHNNLSSVKRTMVKKDQYTTYGIALYSGQDLVATLYSDEVVIQFLEFILANVIDVPISKILQGVQVPKLDDLKSIISSYQSLSRSLTEVYTQLNNDFNIYLNRAIIQG